MPQVVAVGTVTETETIIPLKGTARAVTGSHAKVTVINPSQRTKITNWFREASNLTPQDVMIILIGAVVAIALFLMQIYVTIELSLRP